MARPVRNALIRVTALAIASYWISISTLVTLGRIFLRSNRNSVAIQEISLVLPNTRQLKRKNHVVLSLNLESFPLPPSLYAYRASRPLELSASPATPSLHHSISSSTITLAITSPITPGMAIASLGTETAPAQPPQGCRPTSLARLRLFVSPRQLERLSASSSRSSTPSQSTEILVSPTSTRKGRKYERSRPTKVASTPMDRHAISYQVACTHGLHDTV